MVTRLSIVVNFLIFCIIVIISLVVFLSYRYKHWTRNKISQIEPNLLFGNLKCVLFSRTSFSEKFQEIYELFKSQKVPYGGYYFLHRPELLLLDLNLIKHILVKDFHNFPERGILSNEDFDHFSRNLFTSNHENWKYLRSKLSPTFTSGKMKMMFSTITTCCDELVVFLNSCKESVEIKDVLARFTIDVIGCCAFGIDCNSFRNPDNDFKKFGKLTFNPEGFFDKYRLIGATLFPKIYKLFKITSFNKNIIAFYTNIVQQTISYRQQNNIIRNDFLQLLIQLQCSKNKTGLSINEIIAQCFGFFTAGFESSSSTMSFCLYELAKNEDIQDKLRQEITSVCSKYGNLTYEAIMEMKYLDQVLNETLRKYPPMAFLIRKCNKDTHLPNSGYIIRKGDRIRISLLGIHHDPDYYPNPKEFNPDRFSMEEKSKIPPFAYLPFGEGPRFCIGFRFGKLQAKIGLSTLIKNFRFILDKKTSNPLEMNPTSIILVSKYGIWLKCIKN